MILGHLDRWPLEGEAYGTSIRQAMDFLKNTDLAALPVGKISIDGERLFAMVQEVQTEREQERRWESHQRYTDIQFLIAGDEMIGFAESDGSTIEEQHDDRDLLFHGKTGAVTNLILKPGMYAVFFPGELHRPCCAVSAAGVIRKIVLKIDLN
ncbi:YhcH/YjgK/YiaL family protein [Paenibacillus sp. HB172176]|uniref:YhcH/YjgK/YiaL family protein n=1 Tax=Paenibacillus sp. HB172176 TaxID=2493690 RepID=UPI00143BF287|nr:YhcH/YjgK/YiaL family protein [Paenibacillus sp. HB172176]